MSNPATDNKPNPGQGPGPSSSKPSPTPSSAPEQPRHDGGVKDGVSKK